MLISMNFAMEKVKMSHLNFTVLITLQHFIITRISFHDMNIQGYYFTYIYNLL